MYKILGDSSSATLSSVVTLFLKDGWKLAGPLVIRPDGWFYQPMVIDYD